MRVLIACEESQAVCIEFRRYGHEAYSCDIQECSGGHPEWHIKGDALRLLGRHLIFKTEDGKAHYIDRWDLIIAHPPCTYMSNAGACRMYPKKGQIDEARLAKAMEAKEFFLRFLNADCERIAIENPRPLKVVGLPKETQRIQPYQFGDPWSKLTYLWLKNLPELNYTNVLSHWKPFVPAGTGRKAGGDSYGARIPHNSKARSKTFPGIAKAMAEQWGNLEMEVIPLTDNLFIFDCEVFAYDWLFSFKNKVTKERTKIWNDNEAVKQFMKQEPLLAGFNNKHYDQFILKAVLCDFTPEQIKAVNDFIILEGHEGWEYAPLRDCGIFFDQYDLMDDCQMGLSLKAIEAHLGMDIRETTVSFDIDRPLTEQEKDEVEFYCDHDVDATDTLDDLRQGYLSSKLTLGKEKGIYPAKSLYMTNAKLTAAYLDAEQRPHDDEREYRYPDKLLRQYIPQEVFDFFERLKDLSIPDEVVFKEKLEIMVGDCPCTIAYGGIHGAIPCYREEATETRSIRNKDVASYYPHQMTLNGYCSRNIPSPDVYAATIERRVKAKKAGDKATANALKLVLNTTYGAMLNRYNDLYDPLMGRSVCISGQLQLLEMAVHLIQDCPTLKIIQLNTDGIMVSLDDSDVPKYQEITQEWQDRTGFELEEDLIKMICQKDVNNYVELPFEGEPKIKGGVLVRGIAPAGAFNVNNNACVVAKAVKDYLAYGVPVEQTVMECDRLLDFQLVAKAGSKYGDALHEVDGNMEVVQKVNRVYATEDHRYGTLYKIHLGTGNPVKIAGLPSRCVVDNDNHLTIDVVDRDWYIRLAKRYVRDFLGLKPPKRNTRKVNSIKKKLMTLFEDET